MITLAVNTMSLDCKLLVYSIEMTGAIVVTNGSNCDVPIGATFTCLRKTRVAQEGGDRGREIDMYVVANISLVIQEVSLFNRSVNFIPAGYSARIVISGVGFDLVESEFRNSVKNEFLWLEGVRVNPSGERNE